MQIKDVMTKEVITVKENVPIVTVAEILHRHNIHAVPVVDEEEKVVGIIAETDFFVKDTATVYLPAYAQIIRQRSGEDVALEEGQDTEALVALENATARDIMTPNPITLPDVADIHDMITLIKMHRFKTFPVTDFSGKLVGIVAMIDIIAIIGESTVSKEIV